MKPLRTLEHSLRDLLERLGSKLDSLLGGENSPALSINALLSQQLLLLQRAIDENLREDTRGLRCVAPNRLRVLLDYDTYAKLDATARRALEAELAVSAEQYANDRRYQLDGPFSLKLTYDPVAHETRVETDFDGRATPPPIAAVTREPAVDAAAGDHAYRFIDARGAAINLRNLTAGGPAVGIGRARDNGVILDDDSVSKFHARLALTSDGRLTLADCGSTNGTFVNGQRADKLCQVAPGDQIAFGDVQLRLERRG